MSDPVERLSCFDMAIGPPVTAESGSDPSDRQVSSAVDEAKPTPPSQ
ncbi:hypothetical protein P7D22_12395 [Lichenihabitans sp. Uapishka_5]|nr:hypothetical protein [Lichenihabitans sp. Uapishka_5]MDX7951970.1 hypothetical protein [Lichenihabitans sp. Uapishka_5]